LPWRAASSGNIRIGKQNQRIFSLKFRASKLLAFAKLIRSNRFPVSVQLDQNEEMMTIHAGCEGVDNDELSLAVWRNTVQRRTECLDRTHYLSPETDIHGIEAVLYRVHDSISCLDPGCIVASGLNTERHEHQQVKKKTSHGSRTVPFYCVT
jgi:hypothetical protein